MSKSILKIVLFVLLLTGLLEGIPSIQAQDTGTLQKIKTQFSNIVTVQNPHRIFVKSHFYK